MACRLLSLFFTFGSLSNPKTVPHGTVHQVRARWSSKRELYGTVQKFGKCY
jgi:hypothetical protein